MSWVEGATTEGICGCVSLEVPGTEVSEAGGGLLGGGGGLVVSGEELADAEPELTSRDLSDGSGNPSTAAEAAAARTSLPAFVEGEDGPFVEMPMQHVQKAEGRT